MRREPGTVGSTPWIVGSSAREVVEHDRPLALGGAKQRSLLAVLLLHANEVVATERLIDELWGETPPATVNKSVLVYVSRLRKQLGDGRLVTRAPGYMLRLDPAESDLGRFERLVTEAGGAGPAAAAEKLRKALALWRGTPLADLAYEPFLQGEIARLTELRLSALEQRIDADLATGRHAELVGELDALAAEGFPVPVEMQWLLSISLLPEVCRALDDGVRAEALYEQLAPYERRNALTPPELCRGAVARGLGILAATMSAWERAADHFEVALELNAEMGARPWLAHTHYDYARMLLARGAPGDRERADELLASAAALAGELGMTALTGSIAAPTGP